MTLTVIPGGAKRPQKSNDVDDLLRWLVHAGYPLDIHTEPPIPEQYRRRLAELWWGIDCNNDSSTVEDYEVSLAAEGRW